MAASATRPAVVLCPGLLNDSRIFAPQLAALDGRIVAQVADVASHDSLGDLAAAILAPAPPRFALIGFSMGGYVAFEILRRARQRVTRLALLDTSARPDTPEQAAQRRGLLELARKGAFKGVTPRLMPRLVHPSRLNDATVTQPILAMAADIGRDGFLRQQTAIMGRPDSRPLLPSIDMPTLVLCGRDDQLTPPPLSQEIAAAVPGAHLVLIDDCGHAAPLERPAAVSAALEAWLFDNRLAAPA
ncbi:MAG: alpha/beta fold hydrolase [Alphaproteobacteria bacterium]|nr:alpha/beta fold hydrolase [Alphaproteobacteria bacterium]